jgi:hypothetical protein
VKKKEKAMQNKTSILAVSGATIMACLCLYLVAFFVLASCSADEEYSPTKTARDTTYPLPGPDKSPMPLKNIPEGGLGNHELRAEVWRGILSVTACDPLAPGDVYIEVESHDELTEFWALYCIYDEMEIYHVRYEEAPGSGVNYFITKRPPAYEE